jgi:hypothetical protein
MSRPRPSLIELAREVARALGGEAVSLDEGDYPSAAIAFGGRHALLLRDHGWVVGFSLPLGPSWSVTAEEAWPAEELRRALAGGPFPLGLADAVVALQPELARQIPEPWSVSFPGTPVPEEAWLECGDRHVGLFQESDGVRVVVEAGDGLPTRTASDAEGLRAIAGWLPGALAQQEKAQAEAAAEQRRVAALPVPALEDVLAALRAGQRIRSGPYRYSETFFWDGGLKCEVFDEGVVTLEDATEARLRSALEHDPQAFRAALGVG